MQLEGGLVLRTKGFWVNKYEFVAGELIEPGNWGRIVMGTGTAHPHYSREMAMEAHRKEYHPDKPSRLECCYLCSTIEEARWYRETYHPDDYLYDVRFDSETIPYFQAQIMCIPPVDNLSDEDAIRHYWACDLGVEPIGKEGFRPYEVLTLSPLLVVEILEQGNP